MVDEEDPAVGVDPLLPALGQGAEVVVVSPVSRASNESSRRYHNHGEGPYSKLRGSFEALPIRYVALTGEGGGPAVAGVHPRGLLVDVVDEEDAAVGRHLDQSGVSRWSRDPVSANHSPPAWSSRWADPPC